ncbi:hypothetical protein [Pseudarthrobacter sp. NBSH8]|uniref:hypothetical protein n=1 Tax=Pseudarthrobacter sp. NBSH8 TaxID=2596911 RepID=UPI00162374F7|nr:hypothetical protein [Pseudarthrobacter sp. NBSH8]
MSWPLLIALLCLLTMTLGNLAAYTQTNPRRLLVACQPVKPPTGGLSGMPGMPRRLR